MRAGLNRRDGLFFGTPRAEWRAAFGGVVWRRHAFFMAALAAFFTLSGAYDSGGLSFPARLALWSAVFFAVCGLTVTACLAVRLKRRRFAPAEACWRRRLRGRRPRP